MVSDIQSDIESDLKAAAVRLFAKRCSLDLKPVVDKLLAKGLLTMDVISQLMSLQQPSATGVAVPGSTGGLRAASTFKSTPASEGGLLPSSRHQPNTTHTAISDPVGDTRNMAELSVRQKELLQPYGKASAKEVLAGLKGHPDPFLVEGAFDVLQRGGPAADQLRQKREQWIEANKLPEEKKVKIQRSAPPEKAKLQLQVWVVATTEDDGRLQVSTWTTASAKLCESDSAQTVVERVLSSHCYEVGMVNLTADDVVMLAATDNSIAVLDIGEGAEAVSLFQSNKTEREVYIAPKSRLKDARTAVRDHLGGTPKKSAVAKADGPTRKSEPMRAGVHANNLYVQWCTRTRTDTVDKATATSEWNDLKLEGQAQWLLENDQMTCLSFSTARKYLEAVAIDARQWWNEHNIASQEYPSGQPSTFQTSTTFQPTGAAATQPMAHSNPVISLSSKEVDQALAYRFPKMPKADRLAGWSAMQETDLAPYLVEIGVTMNEQPALSVETKRKKLIVAWVAATEAAARARAEDARKRMLAVDDDSVPAMAGVLSRRLRRKAVRQSTQAEGEPIDDVQDGQDDDDVQDGQDDEEDPDTDDTQGSAPGRRKNVTDSLMLRIDSEKKIGDRFWQGFIAVRWDGDRKALRDAGSEDSLEQLGRIDLSRHANGRLLTTVGVVVSSKLLLTKEQVRTRQFKLSNMQNDGPTVLKFSCFGSAVEGMFGLGDVLLITKAKALTDANGGVYRLVNSAHQVKRLGNVVKAVGAGCRAVVGDQPCSEFAWASDQLLCWAHKQSLCGGFQGQCTKPHGHKGLCSIPSLPGRRSQPA